MILILLIITIVESFSQDLYFTNANVNRKNYYQVPQDELIYAKSAAVEPLYFYHGKLRGKGFYEEFIDKIILEIKSTKIPLYVDYFTGAKSMSYQTNFNYELCRSMIVHVPTFKKMILSNFEYNKNDKNFSAFSIPHRLSYDSGYIGVRTESIELYQKHQYPISNVYNIKGILDDEKLKTVQVNELYSGVFRYIYGMSNLSNFKENTLNKIYKYRVYEFVASDAIQLAYMLRGNRMDWASLAV